MRENYREMIELKKGDTVVVLGMDRIPIGHSRVIVNIGFYDRVIMSSIKNGRNNDFIFINMENIATCRMVLTEKHLSNINKA